MPDYTIKMMRPFVPDEDPAERILKKTLNIITQRNITEYYIMLHV